MLRSPWPQRIGDALFERAVMTLIAISAFVPYFIINRVTLDWPARDLGGPVDALIPFNPAWQLVYFSIFFYLFVLIAYIRDAELFRSVVFSFCSIQFACYAVFLLFPVGIQRPADLDPRGSFLEWGTALNYAIDQPRNLFPSLHLGTAFMAALLLLRLQPRAGRWGLAWATLIGYSTMATRQHYFADVIAGIMVAIAADRWILAPSVARLQGRPLLNPACYAWATVALYPVTLLLLYLAWRQGWQPF